MSCVARARILTRKGHKDLRAEARAAWTKSHRFFKVLVAASVLAIMGAATVRGAPPAAALESHVLWRLEVGLAILLVAYAFSMLMWLAYHGKWTKVPVPGANGGVEPGGDIDEELDSAATDLERLVAQAKQRLDDHDEVIEQIVSRLRKLDGG